MPMFSVTGARLLDDTISSQDVFGDGTAAFPQLDPSSRRMQLFWKEVSAQVHPAPISPALVAIDFPKCNDELDIRWESAVADEPQLPPGKTVEGLDMNVGLLVILTA
jgi:hypothetical protein